MHVCSMMFTDLAEWIHGMNQLAVCSSKAKSMLINNWHLLTRRDILQTQDTIKFPSIVTNYLKS